jgi:hypothetical protein
MEPALASGVSSESQDTAAMNCEIVESGAANQKTRCVDQKIIANAKTADWEEGL